MNSRTREFLINTGLMLVSSLVGFLALEVITRWHIDVPKPYAVEPEIPKTEIRVSVYDSRGFWTWKPGFSGWFDNRTDFTDKRITINQYGGRRIPCANSTEGSRSHVFLIGDSQTFGWGLSDDETWANLLQCELNREHPGKFKVHNFGFPGAQVDQLYARGVKQIAQAVEPGDIVVVSFTWNDLVTFYKSPNFVETVLRQSGLEQTSGLSSAHARVKPVSEFQYADSTTSDHRNFEIKVATPIQFLNAPSWRYPLYKKYGVFIPSFDTLFSFLDSIQFISATYRLAWSNARLLYYRLRPADELFEKIPPGTFKNNFLVLKALATRLKYKGARVLIQLLPNRLFFDDYFYQSYSKSGVVFPSRDYLWFVAAPFCQSLGLTCINRFDDLITSTRNAHTFAFDGHFNQIGAAQIASALALDLMPGN